MADDLPAEGDEAGNPVGIDAPGSQVVLVQADQVGQVAARGMAGDEDLVRGTTVFRRMPESPGDHGRRIFDADLDVHLRNEPVIRPDDDETAVQQRGRGPLLVSSGQPSPMEPDDDGKVPGPFGINDIQHAALLRIGIRRINIPDILHLPDGLGGKAPGEEGQEQDQERLAVHASLFFSKLTKIPRFFVSLWKLVT